MATTNRATPPKIDIPPATYTHQAQWGMMLKNPAPNANRNVMTVMASSRRTDCFLHPSNALLMIRMLALVVLLLSSLNCPKRFVWASRCLSYSSNCINNRDVGIRHTVFSAGQLQVGACMWEHSGINQAACAWAGMRPSNHHRNVPKHFLLLWAYVHDSTYPSTHSQACCIYEAHCRCTHHYMCINEIAGC